MSHDSTRAQISFVLRQWSERGTVKYLAVYRTSDNTVVSGCMVDGSNVKADLFSIMQ